MTRSWVPPAPLPTSLARRDLQQDRRFDVVAEREAVVLPAAYPTSPRIVSSAHGPIRHVMLWYARYAPADLSYKNVYRDLLVQLPPTTKLTIVTHPAVEQDLVDLVQQHRPDGDVQVILTPPSLQFTVWAEDACVVVKDGDNGPSYVVEPYDFGRGADTLLAELVARATDLEVTQSPLHFQGGNVLVGDTFVVVGRDYLDMSLETILNSGAVDGFPYDGSTEEQEGAVHQLFVDTFNSALELHFLESEPAGRLPDRVVSIENELWLEERTAGIGRRQPIFHIDMFVSLAGRGDDGRYRVLVGDPGLADQLLELDRLDHDLQAEYDQVALQLNELGFDVRRSPLPMWSVPERQTFQVKVNDKMERVGRGDPGTVVDVVGAVTWYHPTSNNCLVQVDGGRCDVWLPTYGHDATPELSVVDEEHWRIWTELGFAVHQLGDFHAFASRLGSLHCIKKYLLR